MKIGIGIVVALVVIAGLFVAFRSVPQTPAPEEVIEVEEVLGEVEESPAETSTESASGQVREIVVEGGMMYFNPKEIEVNVGDTVRIVYKNKDGRHDWVIDEFDARTQILGPGQEETIEFVADRAGSFEYYCSVGNHRAMGMKGTLVVKE